MSKRAVGPVSRNGHRTLLINVCKYGLGLGLLGWVLWTYWRPANGSPGLAEALERVARGDLHVAPLVLAIAIGLAALLLTFIRWFILVRAQDLPFTPTDALRLGMIGYSLSTFLPGSVGGDIVKATFLAREQSRRSVAVATVIADRLIGLCGLFWLAALLGSLFWASGHLGEPAIASALESIIVGAWVLCGASALFWLLLGILSDQRADRFASLLGRIPKVGGSVAELWRAVWMYRCRRRSVLLALLLSMAGHVGFVLLFYFAALSLFAASEIPSLGAHFLLVPVGMTIQAGFPAPGGVGGGEYSFGALYKLAGSAFATGVLASLAKRVVEWSLGLVCYLIYLRMRPSVASPPATEEPVPELAAAEA